MNNLAGKHEPSSVINVDLTEDGPAATCKPPLPCLPQEDVAKELPVPAGLCMFQIIHL